MRRALHKSTASRRGTTLGAERPALFGEGPRFGEGLLFGEGPRFGEGLLFGEGLPTSPKSRPQVSPTSGRPSVTAVRGQQTRAQQSCSPGVAGCIGGVTPPARRRGTTMTEVLMAILVMSVGLLAVMSLFPIAFLRSAQGTQLTNAAILKEQAEAVVDVLNLTSDELIPQPVEGAVTRCVIDPLGFQDLGTVRYGVDAALNQYPGQDLGPLTPELIRLDGSGTDIDSPPTPLRRLGLGALNPPTQPANPDPPAPYPPSPGIFGDRNTALSFVALPDQFDTVFSAQPSVNTATQVTFDIAGNVVSQDDLTALTGMLTDGVPLRLILIDLTGKRSHVRPLTDPGDVNVNVVAGTGTIDWNVPLPASFVPPNGAISEVRVESQDLRYTWMLTVRKRGTSGGSTTEIDCVVFLNRPSLDPLEELVYVARSPSNKGAPLVVLEDEPFTVDILFDDVSGNTAPDVPAPPLRRGAWAFDPTYARWYQIQDILEETTTDATIRLDRQPNQHEPITTLVIPRGVVAVLPLDVRRSEGRRL